MNRLPTLFIPHGGGPCFFMDWDPPDTWDRMAEYLRRVPDDVGTRPKALVVISGHWEEKVVTVQNNPAPPLLYDYYGFPQSTYQISFPAPGAPDVSARVAELLEVAGIAWKYDHAPRLRSWRIHPAEGGLPARRCANCANLALGQYGPGGAYPARSSPGATAR